MIASSPPASQHRLAQALQTFVEHLDALDRRLPLCRCVRPYRRWRSSSRSRRTFRPRSLDRRVGDFPRAHRRSEIVGRHRAIRRDQFAVFAREPLFAAAVEKIRDVRVFFGLGQAQLTQARFARERRRTCRTADAARTAPDWVTFRRTSSSSRTRSSSNALGREGRHAPRSPDERQRQLPRAVGTEIEEDARVAVCERGAPRRRSSA